jgi:tetratricopeptide (TPR) repeat protein
MKIEIHSPVRRRLASVIVFAAAALYFGLAAREFVASWLGSRAQLKSLERAVWLEPGDADYRYHVARYYDLVARDQNSAIQSYREAVQLNPHSARYWFDLSNAYQVTGDIPAQTDALDHALQADAMTPDVAWEAANLYMVQGNNDKALHEFHYVLANDPPLGAIAIQYCWRINPDVDILLRDVIPHTADAYISFLTLLESKKETAATIKVWDALMLNGDDFEAHYAYDYFKFLIFQKEVDEANLVWKQTADRFHLFGYLSNSGNIIVNGSFDSDPLNAGEDWQYQKTSAVRLMLDPSDHHSGRRSLMISFDGPGIVDAGIYQLIPVQPNTTYDFSAYYKTDEIEGAGGPHVTLQDMYDQTVYYESDELKDTGFWKNLDGEFKTGADCKLLMLHIRRLPAGSPIRGKLWVDDFHLTRKPA